MKKEKTVQKKNKKSNTKHMQTHVTKPAKNHITRVSIIGTEIITEEEEIEKNERVLDCEEHDVSS